MSGAKAALIPSLWGGSRAQLRLRATHIGSVRPVTAAKPSGLRSVLIVTVLTARVGNYPLHHAIPIAPRSEMLPLIIGALEDQGEQQVHTAEANPLKTSFEAEETDLEELQKSLGQTPIEIFKGHKINIKLENCNWPN